MKDSQYGISQLPSLFKSLHNTLQDVIRCHRTIPNKLYKRLDAMLERKMMEIRRTTSGQPNFKTIDSVIMKFLQFREGFKEIREVFETYDEDLNGVIDIEELRKCMRALEFSIEDAEIDNLFHYCDMDENKGIQLNEFIVLLCLTYLLTDSSTSSRATLNANCPLVETTFNAIIEVFLFLDKRGDGKLRRKDVVRALNEASPKERSPSHITRTRFREMDWDKNGKVSFKEFIYTFISWVGMDDHDESPER